MNEPSSRLKGFYRLSPQERAEVLARWADLDASDRAALQGGLALADADLLVENVVGLYSLPFAIAPNFIIDGREMLIPMVIEEPSVVAALANAARLARAGGGFSTGSTAPVMIGQIQLLDVPDAVSATEAIEAQKEALLAELEPLHPTIRRLGGGPLDLQVRRLDETPAGPMLVVHLLMDTRDAMGANAVNTAAEALAPRLEALTQGRALLRILSNLSDRRRAWASCRIPVNAFSQGDLDGGRVARGIVEANAFAWADPYRAATHNKGIFNGIDAVALATGQDWRAIEAGAHAYAARDGRYRTLTQWQVEEDSLVGRLEIPLAVGTVGGLTRYHPTARLALKILGQPNARRLAEILVAVGLAQNLAALRALVTEGIQRGHMALHARRRQKYSEQAQESSR
ncbi:MAG: hydroxymethylglutaryl-CoA reductase, degradative [Caldilineae bacterium]|nr:MAG: hydroxymethylglutaryl-CoA reductase, degradative [Caldilineae bacterium]